MSDTSTSARDALDWVLAASTAPTDEELRARFSAPFLEAVTAERLGPLLPTLVEGVVDDLPSLQVKEVDAHRLRAVVGETEILLSVEAAPPHGITGLLFRPLELTVTDDRLNDPPCTTTGALALGGLASSSVTGAGLVALSLHVDDRGVGSAATSGWADLETRRVLTPETPFPAYSVTKLLTTVAVLRLVADGQVDLEAPVHSMLTSLSVPPDITVRHLLTHHGAVRSAFSHWADEVPDVVDLLGPEVAVDGPPGKTYVYSNGGFGVLGQLIADQTGQPYDVVISQTILGPLGMTCSTFPSRVPAGGVVLHEIGEGGGVVVPEQQICTIPSAGGLWSTAQDLAAFARGWATLLPEELATAALSPQAKRSENGWIGFGFLLGELGGVRMAGHGGGGIGASSSLLTMPDEGLSAVALTNRSHPTESLAAQSLQLALAQRS